jgi:pyrroloquinoline quinone biosynthesis protein B
MRVRLLGTAAGGAFPQWNCNCGNCHIARTNPTRAKPRTQSCIAISGDGTQWFLINASPDIRIQIESFPPLWPPTANRRGTGVAGILLTNADLDHTLGLLSLRETGPLAVYATADVRRALVEGLNLDAVFNAYAGIAWHTPPETLSPLASTLHYAAFPIPGKPPRYRPGVAPSAGDAVGYKIIDNSTGGQLVVLPDLASIDDAVMNQIKDANVLLLDGTFFTDDEMRQTATGNATASQMGHQPVGGINGSLARIAALRNITRVYVHINNTNPMLLEDSPQRAAVEATGVVIGYDGMEFSL